MQEHKVGADAWRRTGVLTFDGNTKLNDKVTYEKIRQHLEEMYTHKFSYGTVIQLCVPEEAISSEVSRHSKGHQPTCQKRLQPQVKPRGGTTASREPMRC